jgi:hypothetical protein
MKWKKEKEAKIELKKKLNEQEKKDKKYNLKYRREERNQEGLSKSFICEYFHGFHFSTKSLINP